MINSSNVTEILNEKSPLVVQHNYMIEANYRLTLQEQRIILWLVSQIKPDDTEFKEQTIKIADLCQKVGIKSKNMYREIEQITKSLIQNVLQIYSIEKKSLLQIPWLSYAEYLYEERAVRLCFSSKLKPYLLELKERFTSIDLGVLISFRGIYSLRLYELLKQYQQIGVREFILKDLKDKFGIDKNEYALYGHFKEKVINRAQKEINEKSDIRIGYQEIKEGKRVVSIKFFIQSFQEQDSKQGSLLDLVESLGISRTSWDKLLTQYSQEELLQGLAVLKDYRGPPVKNPVQFIKKALNEGWQPFTEKTVLPNKNIQQDLLGSLTEAEACKDIRFRFIERAGKAEYCSWLENAELSLENDVLTVQVKNAFVCDWLKIHYAHLLKEISGDIRNVLIIVKEKSKISCPDEEINHDRSMVVNSVLPESNEKKTKSSSKRSGNKGKNNKEELPPLKQLSLWGRFKSFLRPND